MTVNTNLPRMTFIPGDLQIRPLVRFDLDFPGFLSFDGPMIQLAIHHTCGLIIVLH